MGTTMVFVVMGVWALIFLGIFAMSMSWYKKPKAGQALIRTGRGGVHVGIDKGIYIIPVLHQVETIDLTNRIIEVELSGKDHLICADGQKAEVKVAFHLRINPIPIDIIKVAQTIGAENASDINYVNTLFKGKFQESVIGVGARRTFEDLYRNLEPFKLELLQFVGIHLNGFLLDDCTIDYIRKID